MAHSNGVAQPEHSARAPAVERRLWERLACTRPIPRRLTLEPGHDIQDGWVVDLSMGGMGLLLNVPLEPGEVLSLELESHPDCSPVTLRARVVRSRQLPEGDWLLGCQFMLPLQEEVLQDLLL